MYYKSNKKTTLKETVVRQLLSAKTDDFSQLVKDAVLIIEGNFDVLYGVDDLATRLEVTKHHLIRSFTTACRISPGKYLTYIRIENAKLLLCSDQRIPLELVAAACGYSCANYFCKVFKKFTGQTPMEYGDSYRGQVVPIDSQNTIQKMYL